MAILDFLIEENNLLPAFRQSGLTELDITFIKVFSISSSFLCLALTWHPQECICGGPLDPASDCVGRGGEKGFLYEIVNNQRNGIDVDKVGPDWVEGHSIIMCFSGITCWEMTPPSSLESLWTTGGWSRTPVSVVLRGEPACATVTQNWTLWKICSSKGQNCTGQCVLWISEASLHLSF